MTSQDPAGREPAQDLVPLLRRVQLGDSEAFGALYERFRGDVVRLCARLLADPAEAEDALSEVFLRVREALASYDTSRAFRPWLLSVAAHHCIDRLRRRALEGRLFRSADLETTGLAAEGASPLRATLGQEERRGLSRALDRLDARYRAPLVLRYYAELSYAEIAEALAIETGQVGVLLHRAKDRLRRDLLPSVGGGG